MHAVVCVCAVECPQAAIREGQAKLVRLQESIREQCDGIAQLQAEVRELDGQVAQQRAVSADLLAERLGAKPFSWGQADLVHPGQTRAAYIAALKAADEFDLRPLIAFARS